MRHDRRSTKKTDWGVMRGFTHTVIVTEEGEFNAIAQFYDGREIPWYCYILKDGEWYRGVGDFSSVPEAFTEAKRLLGAL